MPRDLAKVVLLILFMMSLSGGSVLIWATHDDVVLMIALGFVILGVIGLALMSL